jgi:formylglycine-generating enzyme required for sulfatase activity
VTPIICLLPTEAELEYPAQARSTTAFANGGMSSLSGIDPNLDSMGWYRGNSNNKTHNVARKQANAWAFMTCTALSLNGARTGMGITHSLE